MNTLLDLTTIRYRLAPKEKLSARERSRQIERRKTIVDWLAFWLWLIMNAAFLTWLLWLVRK